MVYELKTEKKIAALSALVEGSSIRATKRRFYAVLHEHPIASPGMRWKKGGFRVYPTPYPAQDRSTLVTGSGQF
jgi:hypothetical protein